MVSTAGSRRLMTRSFAVPNTLVSALSKNTGISIYKCNCIETRGGAKVGRRMRACARFRSFEAQDEAIKILTVANAPQLAPEMFLRRVRAALVIVVRIFALLNLRFCHEGVVRS